VFEHTVEEAGTVDPKMTVIQAVGAAAAFYPL
jgi:hypothetical protein